MNYKRFNFLLNSDIDLLTLVNNLITHYDVELDIINKKYTNFAPKEYEELSSLLSHIYFTFKEDLAIAFNKFPIVNYRNSEIFNIYRPIEIDFKAKTDILFDNIYPILKEE
jgi:hypothetical protein